MLSIVVAGVGLLAGVALFTRSAWTGSGPASRVVQFVYYRIGSLERYQKSGRVFASAREVLASAPEPRATRWVRRALPSQAPWFSARFPTDKGGYHDYVAVYDRLFAPYLGVPGCRVLEVGVKKGGSLVLWRELFPADAMICGIDVNPDVPTFTRDAGIKVLVLDSRDAGQVRAALGGLAFDIIIDDGAHEPDSQRRTFDALRPFLRDTGVYVIEDVHGIDVADYEQRGMTVQLYPDPSGEQLAALFPGESLALPVARP